MNGPSPVPPEDIEPKKSLWPWILLQFVPAVAITIGVLLSMPHPSGFPLSWQMVGWMAFLYSYLLSFMFFRSRGKSIPLSLVFAIGTTMVVLVANVVLIVGLVFFGCLALLGYGAASGGKF